MTRVTIACKMPSGDPLRLLERHVFGWQIGFINRLHWLSTLDLLFGPFVPITTTMGVV